MVAKPLPTTSQSAVAGLLSQIATSKRLIDRKALCRKPCEDGKIVFPGLVVYFHQRGGYDGGYLSAEHESLLRTCNYAADPRLKECVVR